jgi:molecular chaperone DnaJ
MATIQRDSYEVLDSSRDADAKAVKDGYPQGANLEMRLVIPLERVLRGGEETVRLARPQHCTGCQGSGAEHGTTPKACEECGGKGQQVTRRVERGVDILHITTCAVCHGRGIVIEKACQACAGTGEIERAETLTLKIPIGVEEGMVLRISGHGSPSRESGGVPGDLHVHVYSAPDLRFNRRGSELWRTQSVPVPDIVLGTELEVPTLDGPVTVTVPAGSEPGKVLRLRGKGLPELGGKRRGDLCISLQIQVPDRLSQEERKLYERLQVIGREGAPKKRASA